MTIGPFPHRPAQTLAAITFSELIRDRAVDEARRTRIGVYVTVRNVVLIRSKRRKIPAAGDVLVFVILRICDIHRIDPQIEGLFFPKVMGTFKERFAVV